MKIDHINIVVADLERAASFYEKIFGWERGFSATLEGEWIEAVSGLKGVRAHCLFLNNPNGGTRIELIRYDSPAGENFEPNSLPNTFGLRHAAFEVSDMADVLEKLRAMGREPLSQPVQVPFTVGSLGTKHLCYFHDPDGTLLEIAAYSN